jgi:branched-chain amino acid transport system permease protein
MRRSAIRLAALLGGVIFVFGLGASSAWAQGEGLHGTLRAEGQPVAGVTITVSTADGAEVGEAVTGEDGSWEVFVPGPGDYRAELDESTLPGGLRARSGTARDVNLLGGENRPVLFTLAGARQGGQPEPAPTGTASPAPGEEEPEELGGEEVTQQDEEVTVVAGRGTLGTALALTYDGIHFGLYIALAALGLSLIFGTMGLVNFSHGELVTLGAVFCYFFNVVIGIPVVVAGVTAVLLGGMFGWAQERWFWGWLRKRSTGLIAMMIISIGVALMLRFGVLYFIGASTERLDQFVVQDTFNIGPVAFVSKTLISDAVMVAVLVAVGLALIYTRWGKATRAVADNPALAAASGINVDRVIRMVWTVGGALAGLSGVVFAIDQGVRWQMGLRALLLIFAAVILGGLGTAFGAMVGALIVGVFLQLSTLVIPNEMKYIGALVILIVVLLVRPQGILGRKERVG